MIKRTFIGYMLGWALGTALSQFIARTKWGQGPMDRLAQDIAQRITQA